MTDQRSGFWDMEYGKDDSRQCVRTVRNVPWYRYQCTRKRGHGPDGLYCKQHGKIRDREIADRKTFRDSP